MKAPELKFRPLRLFPVFRQLPDAAVDETAHAAAPRQARAGAVARLERIVVAKCILRRVPSTILKTSSCRARTRMRIRLAGTVFLTALAASGSLLAQDALDELIQARDLICEFHNTGAPRSLLRRLVGEEHFDMLLVIEAIDPGSSRARAVSSKQTGAKSLRYYKTRSAVHFVQDLASSVVVTTVTGCEKRGRKGGEELCVRYRALNSWHFDTSVHRDPDKAFAKLGTSSYHGSCEPWYLNGVTTAERDGGALDPMVLVRH